MKGLSDLVEIDTVVGMNQQIPHPCHAAPREIAVLLAQLWTDPFDSFSYHFETTDQSVLQVISALECLEVSDGKTERTVDDSTDASG